MAWPTLVATDVLSRKGAKTVGQSLFDRDKELASKPWTWANGEVSLTTTLAVRHSSVMRMPAWVVTNSVLLVTFGAYQTAGSSNNATFHVQARIPAGTWVVGTALNVNPASSYTPYEVAVTFTSPLLSSQAENLVEVELHGQRHTDGLDSQWKMGLHSFGGNVRISAIE